MCGYCLPWKRASFPVAILLLACLPLSGQNAVVAGRVVDPSGAVIPGATIEIVSKATGSRTVTTSNVTSGDFGLIRLSQVNTPRQIQFGLRLSF